jgi:hypothetical protein
MNEEQQFTTVNVANFPPNDLLLGMLLLVCEQAGVGFAVTLVVGGTVVSGHMVPQRVFFTRLAEKMKSARYTNATEAIKSMVHAVFEQFVEASEGGAQRNF